MTITASQVKEIRQEFAKLKPAAVTLDGNRAMTVKQATFTLAPTLERMKKRGFDTQEIVEKLHEKGIEVKAQTLTKYLTEARRLKESRKAKKQDSSLSFPLFYNSLLWPLTATSAYVIAKMKFNSPFTMFYIACNKKFTSLTYTTSILYKIDYPWNIHP